MRVRWSIPCLAALVAVCPARAADPTPEESAQIKSKMAELSADIAALRAVKVDDDLLADVEIAEHAVSLALRFPEELAVNGKARAAISALDHGLQRSKQLKDGKPLWPDLKGRVSRGHRSAVDGTAQPYRVMIPASYDKSKPTPLYVYLHGRGDTDFETGWVGGPDRPGGAAAGGGNRDYIQLQVFGRFNVSFRWAGEADVFEAIASVRKRYNIDPDRIVLAGFSMGGAGAWQIGLRHPHLFAALEVDAGVLGSARDTAGLAPARKAAMTPYGVMIGHALNIFNVPTVGYAGQNDAQLAASTGMREELTREGYTFDHPAEFRWKCKELDALFLAIPGAGHAHATGETAQFVNAFVADALKRGRVVPDHVRFVTYSARYGQSYWVKLNGLRRHFDRAEVDARRDAGKANYTITTKNVSRLALSDTGSARTVKIDGDELAVSPADVLEFERVGDRWRAARPDAAESLRKKPKLQGPLDDAFMDSFLCVTPTGRPFNAVADERGKQELARFRKAFGKSYRGDVRSKDDAEVTDADIAGNNLILFGDPGSNKLLARIVGKLPIEWTADRVTLAGKTYPAADHIPVLIYPNPLNPNRYVVLNSGMTVPERGSPAAAYGDFAVLKITRADDSTGGLAAQVVADGVFDEEWKLSAGPDAK